MHIYPLNKEKKKKKRVSTRLDTNEMRLHLLFFFFFGEKRVSVVVVAFPVGPMQCSRDLQTSFFNKNFIKN